MEILNDILEIQKKQSAKIEELTKEIQQLKNGSNKPVVLDNAKVAEAIWHHLEVKSNDIGKATQHLHALINKIPSEIHNTWGINTSTKVWGAFLILFLVTGLLVGYLLTPKIENDYNSKRVKELENHLQYHIDRNPKTEQNFINGK